jgi:hypothetical protein
MTPQTDYEHHCLIGSETEDPGHQGRAPGR